jgi:hypothetical protein
VLQSVHWARLVLDEAHAIKNANCATAKAACALTARARWCLTGTPLQNRVSELLSMIRFLRVQPYAGYFCKNCPCSTLDYKVTLTDADGESLGEAVGSFGVAGEDNSAPAVEVADLDSDVLVEDVEDVEGDRQDALPNKDADARPPPPSLLPGRTRRGGRRNKWRSAPSPAAFAPAPPTCSQTVVFTAAFAPAPPPLIALPPTDRPRVHRQPWEHRSSSDSVGGGGGGGGGATSRSASPPPTSPSPPQLLSPRGSHRGSHRSLAPPLVAATSALASPAALAAAAAALALAAPAACTCSPRRSTTSSSLAALAAPPPTNRPRFTHQRKTITPTTDRIPTTP